MIELRLGSAMRHLPPTAVAVEPRDLWRGVAALTGGRESVEHLRAALMTRTGSPACHLVSSGRAALEVILLGLRRQADREGTAGVAPLPGTDAPARPSLGVWRQATSAAPSVAGTGLPSRGTGELRGGGDVSSGAPPRRKVVVPAYGCPTVVQAVLAAGLEPLFCDVLPQTLDFEPVALGRLIGPGGPGGHHLLAVVAVHLYGWAQDVRSLLAAARERGFFVIEDAAQAYGALLGGRMVGTWGDAGLYSLGRGKCLPAGRGGVIVAQEDVASDIAAAMASTVAPAAEHRCFPGGARGMMDLGRFCGYGLATRPAGWWFVTRSPLNPADEGMDARRLPPIELQTLAPVPAAVAASILEREEVIRSVRRRNAERLMDLLARFQYAAVPELAPDTAPAFLRLPVVVEDQALADRLFDRLWRQGLGVSRSYRRSLPDLFAGQIDMGGGEFPGAARLATNLLTLPAHSYLRDHDFERIAAAFARV